VTPSHLCVREGGQRIQQVLLDELLLQVGHGEEAVVLPVRRLHAEHPLAPVEGVAKSPGQPLGSDTLRHTGLLQDLHGAAGEDDGAAAFADLQFALQHGHAHALLRQTERGDQPDRPGPDDQHLHVGLRVRGRRGVHLVRVVDRRPGSVSGAVHGAGA